MFNTPMSMAMARLTCTAMTPKVTTGFSPPTSVKVPRCTLVQDRSEKDGATMPVPTPPGLIATVTDLPICTVTTPMVTTGPSQFSTSGEAR